MPEILPSNESFGSPSEEEIPTEEKQLEQQQELVQGELKEGQEIRVEKALTIIEEKEEKTNKPEWLEKAKLSLPDHLLLSVFEFPFKLLDLELSVFAKIIAKSADSLEEIYRKHPHLDIIGSIIKHFRKNKNGK